jgi:hypothetical protein
MKRLAEEVIRTIFSQDPSTWSGQEEESPAKDQWLMGLSNDTSDWMQLDTRGPLCKPATVCQSITQ